MTLPPSTQAHTTDEVATTLYVSIGVGGAVVVLMVASVSCVIICIYLRNSKSDAVNLTDNVVYDMNKNKMELSGNVSYSAIKGEHIYNNVSTNDVNITTSPNEAYAPTATV